MRILVASFLYFAIVFAVGFALGPVRVFWLEPRLGETLASLCEAPFLLIAMVAAARWVPGGVGPLASRRELLAMGAGALFLQQIADFAVGFGLRNMDLAEQLARFATLPGLIYALLLLAFAAMPALVNGRQRE
jgi:hypothetical protein